MVFILLTSCPVKRSIRSLVDLPVHTEQGIAKGNYGLPGNGVEKCISGETDETEILSTTSLTGNHLLPPTTLTAVFGFPIAGMQGEQVYPLNENIQITGTLPIFLRHRKLII